MFMTKIVKIALIPGDGIGKEVMPEGVRVLEAAASKQGLNLEWTEFDMNYRRCSSRCMVLPRIFTDRKFRTRSEQFGQAQ